MKPKIKNLSRGIFISLFIILTISELNATITIHGKTTWNSTTNINDVVIIDSGAVLNILSTVKFTPNGSITVKCGGLLNVSGGTLTNLSNGQMWPGIKVYGTKSQSQYNTNYQGKVVLRNATIKNAQCAILVGTLARNVSGNGSVITLIDGGGIVDAANTLFYNNLRSIHYNEYIGYNYYNYNEVSNYSLFECCNFITDNSAFFNDSNMIQMYLCKVRGIKVKGCTFSNKKAGNRGSAIYSNESGILINEYGGFSGSITDPPYYNTKCLFSGYGTAIYIISPGTTATTILNSDFSNNIECVRTKDANNNRFESNNIDNNGLGVFFDHSTHFIVENNYISNTTASMYFYNGSIPENNFVRYNTFINCCNAFYVLGYYSNNVNSYLAQGLKLTCNYFSNNTNDIYVKVNGSICYRQGDENYNTGNTFANPISQMNLYNDYTNILLYYFYNHTVAYQDPVNNVNIYKSFGQNTPCSGCGFLGNAYYLNKNSNNIFELGQRFTNDKVIYDNAFQVYSVKYSTPINWTFHYLGIEDYQAQIDEFNQITVMKEQLDQICSDAIKILLAEDELDREQFKLWISRYESADADCLLAECYLNEHNTVAMNQVLDSIVIKYNYDPIELSKYKKCMNYLAQWNLTGNTSVFIPNTAVDTLQIIASGTGKSSILANSILLRLGYDVVFDNYVSDIVCDDFIKANISSAEEMKHTLSLIPNPTNDFVSISIDNGKTVIVNVKVYDIYGKELLSQNVNSFESRIDLTEFSRGLYVVACQLENGKVCTNKVIRK